MTSSIGDTTLTNCIVSDGTTGTNYAVKAFNFDATLGFACLWVAILIVIALSRLVLKVWLRFYLKPRFLRVVLKYKLFANTGQELENVIRFANDLEEELFK